MKKHKFFVRKWNERSFPSFCQMHWLFYDYEQTFSCSTSAAAPYLFWRKMKQLCKMPRYNGIWQKIHKSLKYTYKQYILWCLLVIRCLSLLHDMLLVHKITEQIFAMQFLEENVLSFPNTIFYLLTKKQQSTKSLIFVFL